MDSTQASFVHARKDHVCAMCDRNIRKGTTYAKWAVFADGGVWVGKAHQTCREIGFLVELSQDDWEYGPPLGEMTSKEIWDLASEAELGLDLAEIEDVWGTREDAEAEDEARWKNASLGDWLRRGVVSDGF